MEHVLDNPAWYALITGNKELAEGTDDIKYFSKQVSPFVGLGKMESDSFLQLYEQLLHDSPIVHATPFEMEIPSVWTTLQLIKGLQMVFSGARQAVDTANLVKLDDRHIPQMIELTGLTHPGPFGERTIDFGHYYGIFDGDRLVAMAGQRMNPLPYAEISAVCTHPDYTGRGFAGQLLQFQIDRIIAEGSTPILHVAHDNERAIDVYKRLGFETRCPMYFYFMKKNRRPLS